ncbi:hypothetical protein LX92_03244 [Maribacter polysiphoniae]|uniref:Uncharacterized protein n=1 Tax=Maribacter polysiphoniae TaxID=429344 RepID=A0A316E0N1_9FLAO|nr:hypothetical protein LX92_03244 [Maribacter polysiphoniae]
MVKSIFYSLRFATRENATFTKNSLSYRTIVLLWMNECIKIFLKFYFTNFIHN